MAKAKDEPVPETHSTATTVTVDFPATFTETTIGNASEEQAVVRRPERGPMPQIASRPAFSEAIRHAVPIDWPALVAAEIARERSTADGVTPEMLVALRKDLNGYCERLAEWRRAS